MPISTPSLIVPAVIDFKIVPPSTIKGSVSISTLVFVANCCVLITKNPLFKILILGVLEAD